MEEGKVCKKCEKWKLYGEFAKAKTCKDGYRNQCKECRNKRESQRYKENEEEIKERHKQYYKENVVSINNNRKRYYQENADIFKQYQKQYYKENDDYYKEYQKKYYRENLDEIKKRKKEYYQENTDYFKQRRKQYYQENVDGFKQRKKKYLLTDKGKESSYRGSLKRRSYKHNVQFTPHQRKELLERDNYTCQCCEIKVHNNKENTHDKAHIDHVIPISKGGNSEPSNLQVLCRTCNLNKSDKIEEIKESS